MRIPRILPAMALALLAGCQTASVRDTDGSGGVADTYVQLGIEYMREGQLDVALTKFKRALEYNPQSAAAHIGIAILYERLDEDKLAEKHYTRALAIEPKNPNAHNNYGQFLCRKQQYADAEQHFLLAAGNPLYGSVSATLTNAGICSEHIPDLEKAEVYYRQALGHDPRYAPALLRMANISLAQHKDLNARGYLQRYQEVAKHSADSLWLGVRIEHALGDKNASSSYALLLKNNFPESTQTQQLREWENESRSR